jgi:chemotaxis family two-component system response regulator PixH
MKCIAIVNDDRSFIDLVAELLEDEGWEAIGLFEGNRAFEQIKEKRPDLVILDIRMEQPDTGWRILNLLMLDPETRTIPVVMCSSDWNELRQKESWLTRRGVTILPRPFDIDDLYASVESALMRDFPRLVERDDEEREA